VPILNIVESEESIVIRCKAAESLSDFHRDVSRQVPAAKLREVASC